MLSGAGLCCVVSGSVFRIRSSEIQQMKTWSYGILSLPEHIMKVVFYIAVQCSVMQWSAVLCCVML